MFTKISVYSDGFLSYAAAFILSYALFIYNRFGVFKSLALSLTVGFFAATALFIAKRFIGNKNGNKARIEKSINNMSLTLAFYSDENLLNIFKRMLEKQNLTVVKSKRFLKITELNAAFYPVFKYDDVTPQDLITAYKNCGLKKLIVAAKSYNKDCLKLTDFKPNAFILFDEQDVYFTLEKFNLLPPLPAENNEKRTLKTFALKLFKKENYKKLLISGLIVISLSVISSKPLFFIISGAIISLSAVFIKLFAPETQKRAKGITLY